MGERKLTFQEILEKCSDLSELRAAGKIKFEEGDIPPCFNKYSEKDMECGECYLRPACIAEQELIKQEIKKINKGGSKMKEQKSQGVKKPKDSSVFDPRPDTLIGKVRDAVAKVGWDKDKVVESLSNVEKDVKKILGRFNALKKISQTKKIVGL